MDKEAMFYQTIGNSIQEYKDKIEKLETNWKELKKWLEEEIKKSKYKWGENINQNNDLGLMDIQMLIHNFSDVLNKMQELEGNDE